MGYEASYKIVGELDPKFKPIFNKASEEELNKYRNLIIGICMLVKDLDAIGLSKLYDNITVYTKMYIQSIVNNWKVDLEERLKDSNEINVCGWDYSDNRDSYVPEDVENVIINTIAGIFFIAINSTPDILNESTAYYTKLDLINDELNVEEYVYDIMEHSLFNMYAHKEGSEFSASY